MVEEATELPLDALVELADTVDSSETLSKVTCRIGRWARARLLLVLLLLSQLGVVADDSDVAVDEEELELLPVLWREFLWTVLSLGQMYSTPGKAQVWDVRDDIVSSSGVIDTGMLFWCLVNLKGIALVSDDFSQILFSGFGIALAGGR